jgi:hypothetical protein
MPFLSAASAVAASAGGAGVPDWDSWTVGGAREGDGLGVDVDVGDVIPVCVEELPPQPVARIASAHSMGKRGANRLIVVPTAAVTLSGCRWERLDSLFLVVCALVVQARDQRSLLDIGLASCRLNALR